jgi:O-antigen/teichoic acid export membrane protein
VTLEGPSPSGIVRALGLSVGAQVAAKGVQLALNIVVSLAVIRYLGPHGFGDYIFVLTFAGLVGLLSDFGISKIAVREMARDDEAQAAILGTSVAARLALAAATWLLAQLILALLSASPQIRLAVGIASLLNVVDALLSVVAVFQVHLAMQYDALVGAVVQVADTVLVLLFIWRGLGLVALIAAPVISGMVGFTLAVLLARGRFHARAVIDLGRLPALLTEALPIGLALMCAYTYVKVDAVLLALMRSREEVGIYGAAYRPVEYLLLASTVVIAALFPLLARWHAADPQRFLVVYRRGAEGLLAIALPVPVILAMIASPLLVATYTSAFVKAVLPLQVLSVALVLMILNAWQAFTLIAANRQRTALAYDAAAVAVNLGLNFALIPRYGYMGAAVSSLLTSCFITLCGTVAVSRLLRVSLDYLRLPRIVGANLALAASLWLLLQAGIPWWLAGVVAGLVYPGWLLAMKVTNLTELKLFLPARDARVPAPALGSS